MGNFVILSILWRRDRVASENHNKKPLVIERRRGKERKKAPRLTKTYEVKIIPATIGVVMEHTAVSVQTRKHRKPVWKNRWLILILS